jgi:hypothetical protein
MEKTKVNGYIKSIASDTTIDKHPLQTRVSLILTDFNPNQTRRSRYRKNEYHALCP